MTNFTHILIMRDGSKKRTVSFCRTEAEAKRLADRWNEDLKDIYDAGRIDHKYGYEAI